MKRTLILTAAGLSLAGCAVGPNYVSPAPKAPAQGELSQANAPGFVPDEPPADWWKLYDTPVIDRLVGEALAANTDLRVAAANLRQARAVLRETRSQILPSTTVSSQATHARTPGAAMGIPNASFEGETYTVGLDASYQVDLFGKIARGIEAGRADVAASQAAYDLARVTVVAETIRAYSDACAAGQQLKVANQTLKLQEDTFDLTRRLEAGGRGTGLETAQGGALLEQTRATVPVFEAQRKAALFRLATLTGKPPAEAPADVAGCESVPVVRQAIPVGNGATLLARRADVRAAERRLASATAQIGVATADLYPNISIGGSIGSTALDPKDLFKSSSFRFSVGPLLSFSFPNMTVARARIAQAKAGADAALATFDGTWLTALRDTETALAAYVAQGQRVEALRRGRDQSGEAARIARLRYRAGAEPFQTVLDAERSLATNELTLAQAESDFSDATVTLFLALGGGWQQSPQG
ncbi:NodT family efflux transporter outer membrane factor (OMF) lipoprotein [Sphingomonas kyeonggiensis]|uniref:NodT family efflux transporter outer membrane factor (OMF) lipoprotein n=1 Tax=Sphingomonas kyeonggiensis TaxID=1268553 RepID=A0A7W7JXK8_9SPHN|nr:efflux transporter outer membrane subunit [Sphingomonas kyeonggiensis]MBB4837114.1 NodT family efflux transporter outer membrane factor (OMF) lipoprotein [Sphingomonas kyeonggiensis]